MNESLRRKIALLLFFVMLLLGGVLVALYVYFGHGWNLAATEIDDNSGSMDEYLVVLFEGTTPQKTITPAVSEVGAEDDDENSDSASNNTSNSEAQDTTGNNAFTSESEDTTGNNTSNSEAQDTTGNNSDKESEGSGLRQGITSGIQKFFNLNTSHEVDNQDDKTFLDSILGANISNIETIEEAATSYEQKGAEVLILSGEDPDSYSQGQLFYRGTYVIGVLGLTEPEHYKHVQRKIDSLRWEGANTVIVFASRASLLAATRGTTVCIITNGKTQDVESYMLHKTLMVSSSVVGTVDAVIFSPNHIVSAKKL